jgi:exonuclease SbcC
LILSVKVENWKSHKYTELRFGEGTNLLVGPNGGGKSSILEAISFALFGTTPALKKRLIRQEDLITNKPHPAEMARVEVSFLAPDGREFTVKREIRRGFPSRAELREGGMLVEEGPEKVTSYIEGLLGVDYDLYVRAVYSEQDQLDLLLTERERKKKIDELLGIDKLEEARTKAGSLARKFSALAQKGEELLSTMKKEGVEEKLANLAIEIRNLEEKLLLTSREKERVDKELTKKEEELHALQRTKEELDRVERELATIRGSIQALQSQAASLRLELGTLVTLSLEQLREKVLSLTQEFEKTRIERLSKEDLYRQKWREQETRRAQIDIHEKKIGQLLEEINRVSEISKKLQQVNPALLERELEQLQTNEQVILSQKAETQVAIAELLKSLDELRRVSARCPICETPLDESRKTALISEKTKKLQELQLKLKELDQEYRRKEGERKAKESLWKEVQRLEIESRRMEDLKNEHQKCLQKITELKELVEKGNEELELLHGEVEALKQKEEEIRAQVQVAQQRLQLLERLKNLENEITKLQARELVLNRSYIEKRKNFDEQKMKELERETKELTVKKGKLEIELANLQELLKRQREQAAELEGRRKEMRKLEAEVKNQRQVSEYFSKVQQVLVRTQAVLREEFVEMVNDLMDRLWTKLYPYGDFTSLALRVQDGEYIFGLRDRSGRWTNIEGHVSGGERAAACLAMRMAFGLVLAPKLGWLVLDEPTHNLDRNVIAEIAEMLRERLPDEIKQVLLITHEEALESAAGGYLYRLTRDKAKDEPTKVELLSAPNLPQIPTSK